MWSHRERLLKVARRRSVSMEDAEDVVQEALVRAAENRHVDDDRLGPWLTSVTVRLCVDRHRQLSRDANTSMRARSTLTARSAATFEEAVCDRAEARWLALQSRELPSRQAEALRLKADELDVALVAQRMGLTYRAVESLLARARRTLRAALAGTLAVAMAVWRGRPRPDVGAPTAVLASAAVNLVIAGLVLVTPFEDDGARSPQRAPYDSASSPSSYRDPRVVPATNARAALSVPAGTDDGPALPRPTRHPMGELPPGAGPEQPTETASQPPTHPVEPPSEAPELPTLPAPGLPTLPAAPAPGLPTLPPPSTVDEVIDSVRAPANLPGEMAPADVQQLPPS